MVTGCESCSVCRVEGEVREDRLELTGTFSAQVDYDPEVIVRDQHKLCIEVSCY